MKTWNGGSIERAMEFAREMRDRLIAQGASLCDECNGEGGTIYGVCIQCRGAGCILPPEGLQLETVVPALSEELGAGKRLGSEPPAKNGCPSVGVSPGERTESSGHQITNRRGEDRWR